MEKPHAALVALLTRLRRYVDVVLRLLEKAGDFVSDDIWHRVVQLVTNNQAMQQYAASKIAEALRRGAQDEVRVGVGTGARSASRPPLQQQHQQRLQWLQLSVALPSFCCRLACSPFSPQRRRLLFWMCALGCVVCCLPHACARSCPGAAMRAPDPLQAPCCVQGLMLLACTACTAHSMVLSEAAHMSDGPSHSVV